MVRRSLENPVPAVKMAGRFIRVHFRMPRPDSPAPKRILAIASAGGHWQQLMALRPAYEHLSVLYLTTLPGLAAEFGAAPAAVVPDCNRNQPFRTIGCLAALGTRMARFRPDLVISTGALPGVIALTLGKAMGARTIWVDSVANAEEMSTSGRMARRVADLWLSQWEDVAREAGAEFAGALL